MIFELWGNIGVRRGDYKLWASVGEIILQIGMLWRLKFLRKI